MAQHVFAGSGAPATAPTAIGQHYIDTLNDISYISVGTSSPSDWKVSDAGVVAADLAAHEANTSNPHSVTKAQVGLGNADNTSDVNKPVSTAQAAADTAVQSFAIQRGNHTGTQPLSSLSQSGAATDQVPRWNGSAWVPSDSSAGDWGSLTGNLPDQEDLREELTNLIPGASSYYFTNAASYTGGGRLEMTKAIPAGGGAGITGSSMTDGGTIVAFASESGKPNVTYLPSGPLGFSVMARKSTTTKVVRLYAEFYIRTILGFDTLIGTSNLSEELTDTNTSVRAYTTTGVVRNRLTTDYLVIVFKASITGSGADPDVTIDIQGLTSSKAIFPFEPIASVNGQVGDVVLTKSDVGLANVDNTSDVDKPISTTQQAALDTKQNTIAVGNNNIVATDGSGNIVSLPGHNYNQFAGVDTFVTVEPDDTTGYRTFSGKYLQINPTEDITDGAFTLVQHQMTLDSNDDGFDLNPTGRAATIQQNSFTADGLSDLGSLEFISNFFELGNGTDPITSRGVAYSFGFGQIRDGVTVDGPMQGYTFQWQSTDQVTFTNNSYIQSFADFLDIDGESPNYTSYSASPTIAVVPVGKNYQGVNINPTIDQIDGGMSGINISPTLGTFGNNSYFQAININPTIAEARYAAGLNVSMDNVTPYAGLQSTLTIQDLTFTFNAPGDNNAFSVEYVDDGTAGAETLTLLGQAITVHMESGVSTATNIKDAFDGTMNVAAAITTTITGTGSNPQTTTGPHNFVDGENPGQVLAAWLDGNVEITGSLTFGGALSIGKLNAFASQALVDSPGTPSSVHLLISNPTVPASTTVANADLIGLNTAMLLTLGDDAVVTTSFLGLAALGLPAVVNIGANASVDQVSGGTFAISLDLGAGAGGVIDNLDLCRSIAIPNGITTINTMSGYKFDLPFGNPATNAWAFYDSAGVNNFFAGNLLIGGTAGSDDLVTNASVAFEIKSATKAAVLSRMTQTQRDALTAINGMVIYNTTTDKFQGYAAGVWTDLH